MYVVDVDAHIMYMIIRTTSVHKQLVLWTDKANNREKVRILALTCATNCLKDEITFRYPKKYGNMQHATGNKIQLWVFPNNLVAVS